MKLKEREGKRFIPVKRVGGVSNDLKITWNARWGKEFHHRRSCAHAPPPPPPPHLSTPTSAPFVPVSTSFGCSSWPDPCRQPAPEHVAASPTTTRGWTACQLRLSACSISRSRCRWCTQIQLLRPNRCCLPQLVRSSHHHCACGSHGHRLRCPSHGTTHLAADASSSYGDESCSFL